MGDEIKNSRGSAEESVWSVGGEKGNSKSEEARSGGEFKQREKSTCKTHSLI